ncbi:MULTISPECIES: hypothetical protein [unclassified Microcoleus]|uniref:hypothetical protein n=1 Tax=unclassified Microcoleus TaxID=2642155 RepID=UPI002FD26F32
MGGRLSYRKQSEPEIGLPGEPKFHLDRKTLPFGPKRPHGRSSSPIRFDRTIESCFAVRTAVLSNKICWLQPAYFRKKSR